MTTGNSPYSTSPSMASFCRCPLPSYPVHLLRSGFSTRARRSFSDPPWMSKRFGTVSGPGDRRGTMHRGTCGKYGVTVLSMFASRLGKVTKEESTQCIPRISVGQRVGKETDGAWGACKSMTGCVNESIELFGWLTKQVAGELCGLDTRRCVPAGKSRCAMPSSTL